MVRRRVALRALGTLAASGAWSGVGSLCAVGTLAASGAWSGVGSLCAVGTLAASGAWSGVGSLCAVGTLAASGAWSGVGSLCAAGTTRRVRGVINLCSGRGVGGRDRPLLVGRGGIRNGGRQAGRLRYLNRK